MGSSPRRLFAAAALWLVTSSQRARPRRDLGASSAATSGQRYKPQRVATYAGPRLGDTVNRSARRASCPSAPPSEPKSVSVFCFFGGIDGAEASTDAEIGRCSKLRSAL